MGLLAIVGMPDLRSTPAGRVSAQAVNVRAKIAKSTLRRVIIISSVRFIFPPKPIMNRDKRDGEDEERNFFFHPIHPFDPC
jgi:hypothetical protein